MKVCRKCEAEKRDDDFYTNRRVCKSCCSARSMAWVKTEKGSASHRVARAKYNSSDHGGAKNKEYRESPAGRASQTRGQKAFAERNPGIQEIYKAKYYERFPEKKAAKDALRAAVRYGKINKPDACPICGKTGLIHGHHTDYSKPLDVQWLCQPCHVDAHHGGISH